MTGSCSSPSPATSTTSPTPSCSSRWCWSRSSLPSFLASPLAGPGGRPRRSPAPARRGQRSPRPLAASGLLLLSEDRIWVAFVFQGTVAALAAFVKPAIDAAVPNLARTPEELRARQRPARLDMGRDAGRRAGPRRAVQPGVRPAGRDRRRRRHVRRRRRALLARSGDRCSATPRRDGARPVRPIADMRRGDRGGPRRTL